MFGRNRYFMTKENFEALCLHVSTSPHFFFQSIRWSAGGRGGTRMPNAARAAVLPRQDLLSLYSSPLPFSCQESVFRN